MMAKHSNVEMWCCANCGDARFDNYSDYRRHCLKKHEVKVPDISQSTSLYFCILSLVSLH